MWQYNQTPNPDELYHYGVPGMKWGHRKARSTVTVSRGSANRAVNKAASAKTAMKKAKASYKSANKTFNRAYRDANSLLLNSQFNKADYNKRQDAMLETGQKAESARKAYKRAKAKYKMSNKQAKTAVKNVKKQYQKQYMAGESFAGKLYGKVTGADKFYADITYGKRRR